MSFDITTIYRIQTLCDELIDQVSMLDALEASERRYLSGAFTELLERELEKTNEGD